MCLAQLRLRIRNVSDRSAELFADSSVLPLLLTVLLTLLVDHIFIPFAEPSAHFSADSATHYSVTAPLRGLSVWLAVWLSGLPMVSMHVWWVQVLCRRAWGASHSCVASKRATTSSPVSEPSRRNAAMTVVKDCTILFFLSPL